MTSDTATLSRNARAKTHARVVVVGLGGLGCPALWALSTARIEQLVLLDDDAVDESNLGRQILYADDDVGRPKLEAARDRLVELGMAEASIELTPCRLHPENARSVVRGADVVLEGADNYATKFLAADACHLEGVPVIHGAAIGWRATVWAVAGDGGPCYRCLFEDLPVDASQSCESAGVIGPVTGVAGAIMAELALRILHGEPAYGRLVSFDGLRDSLREVSVPARADCPLCGRDPSIFAVDEERYTRQICAA